MRVRGEPVPGRGRPRARVQPGERARGGGRAERVLRGVPAARRERLVRVRVRGPRGHGGGDVCVCAARVAWLTGAGCKCYAFTWTSGAGKGKSMVVQAINAGGVCAQREYLAI